MSAQKRKGSSFPRRTRYLGQGAGMSPLASMGPSPAEGRREVEGSSALPKAELAGSLDRPGSQISIHSFLHNMLPFFFTWRPERTSPRPPRKRRTSWYSARFERKKARAFPNGENPDTSKHGNCSCLRKALILYGYSIPDAPLKVKPCSRLHHHLSKSGQTAPLIPPTIARISA